MRQKRKKSSSGPGKKGSTTSGIDSLYDVDIAVISLERGQTVPGTSIVRIMMDTNQLVEKGLAPIHEGETHMVWGVGVGRLMMPKAFYYGHTIKQAVEQALKGGRNAKELKVWY